LRLDGHRRVILEPQKRVLIGLFLLTLLARTVDGA